MEYTCVSTSYELYEEEVCKLQVLRYTHNERNKNGNHQQTSKTVLLSSELGYNPEEVDSFLEQVSSEIDAMLQKIADLKGRLTNTEQQLAVAQDQIAL